MLEHLVNTLQTCIDYHVDKGDDKKARIVQQHMFRAESAELTDPKTNSPNLYNGEGA